MNYLQSLFNAEAYESVRKTSLVISGWLCTIGGLVADVLQPIAPFTVYLFFLSIAALLILAILYAMGKKELIGALVLAGIAGAATGSISLMQQGGEAAEIGIVASAVPAVADLQERLGLIEKQLDEIKQDTRSIKESTTRIESKSDEVLQTLGELKEGIETGGGIIASPNSPEDHYHNARIYELGGDYAAARRSYLEYFKSDLPLLDPHLRFISFLKVQEGRAGAIETYNAVTAHSAGPIPAYARRLLLDREQRVARVKTYLAQNPSFAPAAYQLSLDYSERLLGTQTIADKREELAHLKAFQEIDETGGLVRYLIDQSLAEEWREDAAARRLAVESSMASSVLEKPVSISWMAHSGGWNGNIQISEPVLDIKWNIKDGTQPVSTGTMGHNDPNTGQPFPRRFFSLPKNQGYTTIEIRYTDQAGIERGPYEFPFQPQKESDDENRRILEMTSTSWVSFRDYEGEVLLYFSHLLSYRGAISTIEYGIDQATPDRKFEFPPYSKPGVAPVGENVKIYLTLPSGVSYVSVQLTYKNGEKSPITRFDRS